MRSILLRFAFLLGLFALSLPAFAYANTLGISPAAGSFQIGDTIQAALYVTSTAQSVNAVSGTLSFPADQLQVSSISTSGSVVSLWVANPTFSNAAGSISFQGIIPNPGFQGSNGEIAVVNFNVIGSGAAPITWSAGSVLANDGSGTNILQNLNTASYDLGGGAPPVVSAPAPQNLTKLIVTSSSYPDSTKWYATSTGEFSWAIPDGTTAVRMSYGIKPISTPTVVYAPAVDHKEILGIADGVGYFHIQAKIGGSWGPVTDYKFQVDTAPPDSFSVVEATSTDASSTQASFIVAATDALSGVDHYSFAIDGRAPVVWKDDSSHLYQTSPLEPGSHSMLASVFDAAGNSTSTLVSFATTGLLPVPVPVQARTSFLDKIISFGQTLPNYIIPAEQILALIIPLIALLFLLVYVIMFGIQRIRLAHRRFKKQIQDADHPAGPNPHV